MNPLFVGIDVSSRNNVAYLMKPDGSKYSSFSVQNNLGGAKLLSERIVSALGSMQLSDVVSGLEATSIYGDSLVYALREDGRLGQGFGWYCLFSAYATVFLHLFSIFPAITLLTSYH